MQLLSILLIVPLAAALPTLFEKKLQVIVCALATNTNRSCCC